MPNSPSELLEISEVALLCNMQSIGPFYISDSNGMISPDTGMLLAARLVITSGIGNTSAKTEELYGPLPVPELVDGDYLCYLFNVDMQQLPIPGSSFSTGKGTLIFTVIFRNMVKENIYYHRKLIEDILKENAYELDFSGTVTGMISPEIKEKSKNLLLNIYQKINSTVKLAEKYRGGSLFNIGFLVSLPEELNLLAKQLIQQPNGWRETDINDSKNLATLISVGLVKKENRDGVAWIIPM